MSDECCPSAYAGVDGTECEEFSYKKSCPAGYASVYTPENCPFIHDPNHKYKESVSDEDNGSEVVPICEVSPMATTNENQLFEKELEKLINYHSIENESDTPDFILAEYMKACLDAFNVGTRKRDKWYGRDSK